MTDSDATDEVYKYCLTRLDVSLTIQTVLLVFYDPTLLMLQEPH